MNTAIERTAGAGLAAATGSGFVREAIEKKLKALEAECGSAAAIIVRQNQEIEQLRAQIEQSNAETMHNTKHDAEPSSRSGLAHTHGQVA